MPLHFYVWLRSVTKIHSLLSVLLNLFFIITNSRLCSFLFLSIWHGMMVIWQLFPDLGDKRFIIVVVISRRRIPLKIWCQNGSKFHHLFARRRWFRPRWVCTHLIHFKCAWAVRPLGRLFHLFRCGFSSRFCERLLIVILHSNSEYFVHQIQNRLFVEQNFAAKVLRNAFLSFELI